MGKNSEEILQLTVQEATEELLMSQSSVYSWIERGKLKTEDLPSGKVIVISRKEAEKIKEYNLKSRRNKVSKQIIQNSDNLQEENVIDAEFSKNYEENVTNDPQVLQGAGSGLGIELAKLISDLSLKAGKVELLADLQKQNREDAEYWRNEFFKLQAENNALKSELAALRAENERRKPFLAKVLGR